MFIYGSNIIVKNIPLVPTNAPKTPKTIWETIKNYVFPVLRVAVGIIVDVIGDILTPFSLGLSLGIKIGLNTLADGIFNLIQDGRFYISYWSFINFAGIGFTRWIGSFKQFSKTAKYIKTAKKLFNDSRNLIFNTANFLKGELLKNSKKLGSQILKNAGVKNANKLTNSLFKFSRETSRIALAVVSGDNVEKKLVNIAFQKSLQKLNQKSKTSIKKTIISKQNKNPLYVNEVRRLKDNPKILFIDSSWLSHLTFLNNLWREKYALGQLETQNFILHFKPEATQRKMPIVFFNKKYEDVENLVLAQSPGRFYLDHWAYGRIAGVFQEISKGKGIRDLDTFGKYSNNENFIKITNYEHFRSEIEKQKKLLTPFARTRGRYKSENKIGIITRDAKGFVNVKYTNKLSTINNLTKARLNSVFNNPSAGLYIRKIGV